MLLILTAVFFAGNPLAKVQQPAKVFPIPAMQEVWPGAKLNETNRRLLSRAIKADLRELEKISSSDKKSSFDDVDTTDISLGSLGKGVIVEISHSELCGTGGCPIYAYVREKAGYKRVLRSFGWAFAVVKSDAAVPDLVVASNGGGGQVGLTLYRYNGEVYARAACETLKAKQPGSAAFSWWDAASVDVEPCVR